MLHAFELGISVSGVIFIGALAPMSMKYLELVKLFA